MSCRLPLWLPVLAVSSLLAAAPATAQFRREFDLVPRSGYEFGQDIGVRAHTHHSLHISPYASPNAPGGLTPQQVRAAYNLPVYDAANGLTSDAGAQIVAVIIAYHYPSALHDFNVFSSQFGLPEETSTSVTSAANRVLQVAYASGRQPAVDTGWAQEAALDIEWSHAMAPNAKILLVEASSSSFSALLNAVRLASTYRDANGNAVKEITMSWGGSEFSMERYYDGYFTAPGVVYFAASGDVGGTVNYPSASPYVVACGGTTLRLDSAENVLSETGWSGSGGGVSRYEARPSYQAGVASIVGSRRGTPDLSFDADPATGVSVYDSTPDAGYKGWMVFGGTSVSSPSLAGIVNSAASAGPGFASNTIDELLNRLYANRSASATVPTATSAFRDIVSGRAGRNTARAGYDLVTGVGSVWGLAGK